MAGDPLSEILAFVGARCRVAGGFTAGGRWGIRFPRPGMVKFGVIAKGACWMRLDDIETPLRLDAGDVYFVKGDRPFDLVSDFDVHPEDAVAAFRDAPDAMVRLGSGDDVLYLGGHVALEETRGALLIDELPPVIHVAGASEQAAGLQWLVRELVSEVRAGRAGTDLSTANLAQLLFVRVLRTHLDTGGDAGVGWLRGLGDARIAAALSMMHAEPGRPWQLRELARAVGMSRSVFAARFKATVGTAPLSYLTAWRMRLAAQALERDADPVSRIAETLGYTSVSAFSNAFKRTTGAAPKRFQSALRASAG
ncbi:MAG: AraC family transcriptional regulator [Rhodobiaceae bacterium]|nr:AraC family transcriptional regulator [Rhodobiaceae bacterium]